MTQISQTEWDTLNAYSDGELPAADVLHFEARLRSEPELQEALGQIRGVGLALKPLKPGVVMPPVKFQNKKWFYGCLAIAASVALMLTGSALTLLKPNLGLSPTELHHAYLEPPFDVSQGGLRKVVSREDLPDLATANLTLVADTTESNAIRSLHYAGRNECRLTLTITNGDMPNLQTDSDLLLASWRINSIHYTLLANGMDGHRFAAIADFVRDHFKRQAKPATVIAMHDATKSAVPCKIG